MEEREYFHELCVAVLTADKNVRFAGVIEGSGKLIVGEYRKDIQAPLIAANHMEENLVQGTEGFTSSFAASRMVSMLNKQFESGLGQMNYHLTEYSKVKLLTVALSNENSYYLCISMDAVADCHPVIVKVLNSI
ncbi:MAG: hypothetical protein AB1351_11050 [Thermoproteota archaeon]